MVGILLPGFTLLCVGEHDFGLHSWNDGEQQCSVKAFPYRWRYMHPNSLTSMYTEICGWTTVAHRAVLKRRLVLRGHDDVGILFSFTFDLGVLPSSASFVDCQVFLAAKPHLFAVIKKHVSRLFAPKLTLYVMTITNLARGKKFLSFLSLAFRDILLPDM